MVMKIRTLPYALTLPALVLFAVMLVVPIGMIVILSFYGFNQNGIVRSASISNWIEIFNDSYYLAVFARTLRISIAVTLLSALFGVPEAYILTRLRPAWRNVSLLVILGPLLVSTVVRTLGWVLLLSGGNGIVNRIALGMGLISQPLSLMYHETGVVIALTHVLIPYMVLAVWSSLQRLNPEVENAALSLGASKSIVMRRIVVPQIAPGILSGAIIVFALSASSYATPAIIGGRRLKVAAMAAFDEFLNTLNWPLGAAIAIALLIVVMVVVLGSTRFIEKRHAEGFK
ncbi:ABC transporter permease [Paraburkholderia caledonica]|uniref:Spermidine/putrescine transport system permease protein n=1 Tax=Paraburkholderia caledonica TaxID=134536 RepID=A0AB73IM83_9BURK|nr:putative spermidine/putrescine transport system permease protein [Paraburkholderia caledonica]